METKDIQCGWCKKPENQWTNTLRWWSARGKKYCSAQCFAAAHFKAHIVFAVFAVPILWFPTMSLAWMLMSETSSFNLVVSLWLIGIVIVFTSACVYMVAIGKEERGKGKIGTS